MTFIEYTWLIPLIPIIGLLLAAAFGKRTPEGGGYFVVGAVAVACFVSLMVAYEFFTGDGSPVRGSSSNTLRRYDLRPEFSPRQNGDDVLSANRCGRK